MYGNVNRKKNKSTGEYYKDHWYYACKHRAHVDGVPCTYRKQWHQGVVNGAVEEVISKMAHDSLFAEAIKQRISSKVDTVEVEKELEDLQKKLRKLTVAKDRVGFQIDGLDFDDVQYERKYQDLQTRLETLYDEIYSTEGEIHQVEIRLKNIEESRITTDNIYSFLLNYDKLYGLLSDIEKKQFLKVFVEEVQIFPDVQPDGKFLRSIKFGFPIPYDGSEVQAISWDKENTVETVVLLSKGEVDSKKIRVEFSLEDMDMSEFQDGATYTQIKDYVLEHSGLKVSNLYISQIKRKCGIEVGKNYNLPKSEDSRQPLCPPEKEKAIREAFKYFGII